MSKRLLAFSVVFILSLAFALSASAASLPSGTPEGEKTINYTLIAGVNTPKRVGMNYDSGSTGILGTTLNVNWSVKSTDITGASYPSAYYVVNAPTTQPYTSSGQTQILELTGLMSIDSSLYDVYLDLAVRVFYPENGLYMQAYFFPIYTSLDGSTRKADTSHAQSSNSDYATVTYGGKRYVKRNFYLKYMGVSATWIPDGYKLSGFGVRYVLNGDLTGSSYYYTSSVGAKWFFATNASTKAIEAQTEALSKEIQEQTDTIVNGWTPSPESPVGSDDINDYNTAESELLGATADGVASGLDFFDNLGLGLLKFGDSFKVFIAVFDDLLGIEWLHILLTTSLALGTVAFVLNVVPTVVNRLSNHRGSGSGKGKGKGS